MKDLLIIAALIGFFAGLFAVLTWAERKLLGRVQNRPGPNRTGPFGVLQPVADGVKMLTKEDIVPAHCDRTLHLLAPVVVVALSILTFAVIPFGRHWLPADLDCGILFFFAAGSGTELAVFMAGWASRNKYSLLAAMRALAQLISYELPLLLSWVPVVIVSGSLSTQGVVLAQSGWAFGFLPRWNVFTPWGAAGLVLFLIAAVAECNRSPFDLPEAESELIAGHLTEYSGFKYALFFMAEYFGMSALSAMAVTLFLGGWGPPLPGLGFVPTPLWFLAKLLVLLFGFIWLRATWPRLRLDQLTRLGWLGLLPLCLVNLAAAGIWRSGRDWPGAGQIGRWLGAAACIGVPAAVLLLRAAVRRAPRTYAYRSA